MQFDEIPILPEIRKEDFPEIELSQAYKGFEKAQRKIMMYETDEGQFMLCFQGLDDAFYASFVTCLSQPNSRHNKLYTFLKLCLEGTRLLKQFSQKTYQTAVRIQKAINNTLSGSASPDYDNRIWSSIPDSRKRKET
jgi:hypothetical protein